MIVAPRHRTVEWIAQMICDVEMLYVGISIRQPQQKLVASNTVHGA